MTSDLPVATLVVDSNQHLDVRFQSLADGHGGIIRSHALEAVVLDPTHRHVSWWLGVEGLFEHLLGEDTLAWLLVTWLVLGVEGSAVTDAVVALPAMHITWLHISYK